MAISRQFWRILWLLTIIEILILLPRSLPIIPHPVIILFSVSFHSSRSFFQLLRPKDFTMVFCLGHVVQNSVRTSFLLNFFKTKFQKHICVGKRFLVSFNEGSSTLRDLLLTCSSQLSRGVLADSERRRSDAVWESGNRYDPSSRTQCPLCVHDLWVHSPSLVIC